MRHVYFGVFAIRVEGMHILALWRPRFSAPPAAMPLLPVTPATERIYRIQNDPNAVQGAIRLAQAFPNRHHPDFKKWWC